MTDEIERPTTGLKDRLKDKMFGIEHALGMHAVRFCTLPAEGIYDKDALEPLMSTIRTCHIYMVGLVPRIDLKDVQLQDGVLVVVFTILGKDYMVKFDVPNDWILKSEEGVLFLEDAAGKQYGPNEAQMQLRLSEETEVVDFEVKYIGQAYGQDGSRNALDRLLKHETLQKISLKGIPDGYRLTLLLLAIENSAKLMTMFNPFATKKDENGERIRAGLDKLRQTSEQESTTLYEASLIRYFSPEYNTEFKDSFPSTNLKVLQDCYQKDFSAVIAEICHDEIPFRLKSKTVAASKTHIAKFHLHDNEARKMFFGF